MSDTLDSWVNVVNAGIQAWRVDHIGEYPVRLAVHPLTFRAVHEHFRNPLGTASPLYVFPMGDAANRLFGVPFIQDSTINEWAFHLS